MLIYVPARPTLATSSAMTTPPPLLPQPATVACKVEEAQSEYVHVAYKALHVFGADLHARSALSNKISASELREEVY